MGEYAFYGGSYGIDLCKLSLPSTLKETGIMAFAGNQRLTQLEFADDIKTIDEGAFAKCSSLISFSIPKSMTRLSKNLFLDCVSLQNVIFHNQVTTLGEVCV